MRMIPDTPYKTNSNAEKKVFDFLRKAFAESSQDYTCFHSMNLVRHARKRFGEADFLISCPDGLYVLEIKGGRVECRNGIWRSTDRTGEAHIFNESPFQQAETALHAVAAKLKEMLPESMFAHLVFGYGVVFPDCRLGRDGFEWDAQLSYDQATHRNFEDWLGDLFDYWRKKANKETTASRETLESLRQHLRPDFEAIVPLHTQTAGAEERIATLTEDQMALVDIAAANKRVVCSGGAGTGKTFLAVELARRWSGRGLNLALVCRSPWLKNFLHSKLAAAGATVCTISALKRETARQGIDKFDALIIDEGQDLLQMEHIDTLDRFVDGGLGEGRWCFFHDANNQSGFFGDRDEAALRRVESLGTTSMPLRTNCRNTKIIIERVKEDTGADMGVKGAGAGPRVRRLCVSTADEAASALESEIRVFVDDGGLAPGQITILAPSKSFASLIGGISSDLADLLVTLDEYSARHLPSAKAGFCRIKDFKGLENEAVIVVGLPPPPTSPELLADHYVAMSRARALLSLIYIRHPHGDRQSAGVIG